VVIEFRVLDLLRGFRAMFGRTSSLVHFSNLYSGNSLYGSAMGKKKTFPTI